MRPVNKLAAMGVSHAAPEVHCDEVKQPAAFGRPTLHLNQPVTIRRRTKGKYIRAQLSDEAFASHFERIIGEVTRRDDAGRPLPIEHAQARARAMVIEELDKIVGPHQIASPAKHEPFQRLLDKILARLDELQGSSEPDPFA